MPYDSARRELPESSILKKILRWAMDSLSQESNSGSNVVGCFCAFVFPMKFEAAVVFSFATPKWIICPPPHVTESINPHRHDSWKQMLVITLPLKNICCVSVSRNVCIYWPGWNPCDLSMGLLGPTWMHPCKRTPSERLLRESAAPSGPKARANKYNPPDKNV